MAGISLDAQGVVQGGVAGGIQTSATASSKGNAQDWISGIEKSNLTPRYYLTIGLLVLQEMFEFYDFFLVGYLVSVLAPNWHLTYGQSAVMLLSSGVGAIVGSLVGGMLADAIGRKKMVWGGGLIFSLGAAGCALIPDGSWILFSILRFVVGFGSIAAVSAQKSADRRNDADQVPYVRFEHDGGAGRARDDVCRDDFGEPAAGDRLARCRCHRRDADRNFLVVRVDRAGIGALAAVARTQRRRAARSRKTARRSREQRHIAERHRVRPERRGRCRSYSRIKSNSGGSS